MIQTREECVKYNKNKIQNFMNQAPCKRGQRRRQGCDGLSTRVHRRKDAQFLMGSEAVRTSVPMVGCCYGWVQKNARKQR